MSSRTEICNIALGHFGTAKAISDFTTDDSTEGKLCRRFYEVALKQFLRSFSWSHSKRFKLLGLVEEDPTNEWTFSYRYPSDALKILRLNSSLSIDNRQSRVPYILLSDDTGKLIFTREENACAWYTKFNNVAASYPLDFVFALSYLLAWYISPTLTKGDPFKIRVELLGAFQSSASTAMANDLNEEQIEEDPVSEFERNREGVFNEEQNRRVIR